MDIFVSNIPPSVDKMDLISEFHRIIHRHPFPTDPLINFDLFIMKTSRNARNNRKSGILTLPTRDVGELFLNLYRSGPISIQGIIISCSAGRKAPRETTLARIRGQPWEDPEFIKQERRREEEASYPTPNLNMSFGHLRRDGTFTIEHSFAGRIHCDLGRRRLVVEVTREPGPSGASGSNDLFDLSNMMAHMMANGFSLPPPTFWYPSASLRTVIRSRSTNFPAELFFEFSNPATFEQPPNSALAFYDARNHPPQRLPGLPGCNPMPQLSQHLRVVFADIDDFFKFMQRARNIQFPDPKFTDVVTTNAHAYDSHLLNDLSTFMKSLPFPLAFQIEKSVWDGIIEPAELCDKNMQSAIRRVHEDYPEAAAAIFRYFVSTLHVPTFRDPPRRPPPERRDPAEGQTLSRSAKRNQRRRRNRRRELALSGMATTLHEQLLRSADAYVADAQRPRRRYASTTNPSVYEAYHVSITPSSQVLEGPLPDLSNGILRLYRDHQSSFLRVSFKDEDGGKPRRDANLAIDNLLDNRYKPVLLNGITVGGRKFEFLGYSMSSLKDYTFIFISPFEWKGEHMNADNIRKKFGNIPKASHRPALLGARWGQMFSASTPSVSLTRNQVIQIDDRQSSSLGGQNTLFTDGCSTISCSLARRVARRVLRSSSLIIPSCFQFRLGGAKGVLFQDPFLEGEVMCLRPSQTKFDSPDLNLDITLTSARPLALFLNRPLIALLEHHRVPMQVFINLQNLAIRETQNIRTSLVAAATTFAQHGLGTSFQLESLFKNIAQILHLELAHQASQANSKTVQIVLLKIAIAHGITYILREIKHRGRIRVPDSFTLLGVSDEWDCLEEGEVYAQVYDPRTQETIPIEGKVVITRSPQIHPGDIQFVRAVRRPELEHLKNVVVFSCRGARSLPSMLGGGDLDGDIYNIILDTNLHPPKGSTAEAGAYNPLSPTVTPHPCGINDVVDFLMNFIKSDLLGYISTTHLRISDLSGLDCADCLKLAEAASHAVDFPKVGTAVEFKTLPKPPEGARPDYLSGEGYRPRPGDDRYYPSAKVLGALFRRVPTDEYEAEEADWTNPIDFAKIDRALAQAVRLCLRRLRMSRFGAFSANLVMEPEDDVLDEMHHIFDDYREQLLVIAKTHTTSKKADIWLTEAELISGAIMERYPDPKKRREVTSAMNLQTQELTRKIRLEFSHGAGDIEDDDNDDDYFNAIDYEEDPDVGRLCSQFNRARAAWVAAQEILDQDSDDFGVQSFSIIALGSMLNAIKALEREANNI